VLPDLIVRSRRVVTEKGTRAAAIHIHGERIVGVLDFDDVPDGCPIDDVSDAVVMPGVVDTHVHAGDRGNAGSAVETVTRAAAAGGVTTIVVMPFPGPAITSVPALEATRRAASGRCFVDVGFWGGVVPDNAREIAALFEAGVFGFKCVLLPTEFDDFAPVSESDLQIVMPALTTLGAVLLVHAELPGPIAEAERQRRTDRPWLARARSVLPSHRYANYLASRPKAAENEAVELLTNFCGAHGTRTHVVHLSSSEALTPLFRARASRLPMTAETCPHYLLLVADELRADAAVLTAPPIRERENREFLWAALANGLIQSVASDHAFVTRDQPRRRCGCDSVQLLLSATWTGAHGRGYTLEQLTDWLCRAPARLAGLHRKGRIDVGYDADLVVFEPDAEFTVEPRSIVSGGPTPYAGRRFRGTVERTYLRGSAIYSRASGWSASRGQLLRRGAS
jgi:allantoinase